MDGNGKIDATDALTILQYSVKLIPDFPCSDQKKLKNPGCGDHRIPDFGASKTPADTGQAFFLVAFSMTKPPVLPWEVDEPRQINEWKSVVRQKKGICLPQEKN